MYQILSQGPISQLHSPKAEAEIKQILIHWCTSAHLRGSSDSHRLDPETLSETTYRREIMMKKNAALDAIKQEIAEVVSSLSEFMEQKTVLERLDKKRTLPQPGRTNVALDVVNKEIARLEESLAKLTEQRVALEELEKQPTATSSKLGIFSNSGSESDEVVEIDDIDYKLDKLSRW